MFKGNRMTRRAFLGFGAAAAAVAGAAAAGCAPAQRQGPTVF